MIANSTIGPTGAFGGPIGPTGAAGSAGTNGSTGPTGPAPTTGGFSNLVTLTASSGTFTVPAGITNILVTCIGGGGGTAQVISAPSPT